MNDTSKRRAIDGRIRSARQSLNLTQKGLAIKLGVSAGAVGQWETGGVPATDRLVALAESLDVSLDWLLGTYSELDTPGQVSKEMLEDMQLLAEARRLGWNLRQLVVETRQQRWIEENRGALADANAFLDRHGLWSDGKRQF